MGFLGILRDSWGFLRVSGGGGGILKGFLGRSSRLMDIFFVTFEFDVLLGLIGILWDSWGFLGILRDSWGFWVFGDFGVVVGFQRDFWVVPVSS